ncbi:MAG: tetratricopeptide repeat protein [Elusimicrobiota bacterium]
MKKAVWVITLVLTGTLKIGATLPGLINEGNKLYENSEYQEASKLYKKALEKKEDSVIYYNLGNAAFKLENYSRAADYYEKSLNAKDENLRQKASYNLGNTKYREEEIENAVGYWKEALIMDPDDNAARHNLLIGLKKLEEEEKEKKKEEEQDDEDKNNGKGQGDEEEDPTVDRVLKLMEHNEKKIKRELKFDISDFYGIEKLW